MTIARQFPAFPRIDCIFVREVGYCSAAEPSKNGRCGAKTESIRVCHSNGTPVGNSNGRPCVALAGSTVRVPAGYRYEY